MTLALDNMRQSIQGMLGQKKRWWFFVVAAVLVFFLFTHQREDSACNHNVKIYCVVELQMNCDTNSINNLAHDPAKIFTEFHNWKGRPIYLAYGIVAGQALMPFVQPVWKVLIKPWTHMKAYSKNFSRNFHMHLAFILLNVVVVFYAAKLSIRLSEAQLGSLLAVSLAASVASFELVQGGVYMFHTNLFNMLTALGAAAYASLGMSMRFHSMGHLALLGGLVGLGILTYPSLVILVPAYVVGALYGKWRWPEAMPAWPHMITGISVLIVSSAVLPLAWYFLNTHVFVSDVYLTAKYGQFVWVLEAYRDGRLFDELGTRAVQFYGVLQASMGYEFLLAMGGMAVLAAMGGKAFWRSLTAPIVVCLAIAALGMLSFNFLQGYYAYRLQACVLLLIYILVARTAYTLKFEKTGAVLLASIAAFQLIDAALHSARA